MKFNFEGLMKAILLGSIILSLGWIYALEPLAKEALGPEQSVPSTVQFVDVVAGQQAQQLMNEGRLIQEIIGLRQDVQALRETMQAIGKDDTQAPEEAGQSKDTLQ